MFRGSTFGGDRGKDGVVVMEPFAVLAIVLVAVLASAFGMITWWGS